MYNRDQRSPRFIDTHCHLFWDTFQKDLDEVIARARAAGVDRMLIPATDFETFEEARIIAERFDGVYLAVGIHPHDVGEASPDFVQTLRSLAAHPKVVAIGEIGLDYYYDFSTPAVQQKALHAQIEAAIALQLPVILHNRESDDDLLAVLREHQDGSLEGQFHCFSSGPAYARQVLDAGFHLSFTGNVTFKKSVLDPVLSFVPDDRLLIETDAPFMTPVPDRGKRNEPSYIPRIAERYAQARHQSIFHIAAVTTQNAERLYSFSAAEERAQV
ncbi:TatD family hydrolase [bacterium]|nr:TatD family hydrolase [bacterium]